MSTGTKVCRTCNESKPLEQFRGIGKHICADGRTNNCVECIRTSREVKRSAASDPQPAIAAEVPEPPEGAQLLAVGPSIGFRAWRDGDDVVIVQESANGTATIWLTPAEIGRLHDFAGNANEGGDAQ